MSHVSEALVAAAHARGHRTTAEMARRMDVPYLTVYRWVTGRNTPSPEGLAAIERTYGLTSAALHPQQVAA
ncbi:helix-turn-helix domain-containing protein [Streptomyces sp. 2.9]|uniref:helix-turn-helix domain-containing protein n=1 Tax=Streptomyces tritrimontium TaxID=3406573 RepID=UPI003BB4DF54